MKKKQIRLNRQSNKTENEKTYSLKIKRYIDRFSNTENNIFESRKEYQKRWRQENPCYSKEYYKQNKAKIRVNRKVYYRNNKEKFRMYMKHYRDKKKEWNKKNEKEIFNHIWAYAQKILKENGR